MVEKDLNELAVIFEPIINEDSMLEFVPKEVKLGTFSELDDVFIDSDAYTYSHIFDINFGRGYAYKENISEALLKYPDKSLNEIKNDILVDIKKFRYVKGVLEESPVVFIRKPGEKLWELLKDEYTENILMLFDEEDCENINFDDYVSSKSDSKFFDSTALNFNPHKLFKDIKKKVIGQDEAIKKIITTIWENGKSSNNSNMIVLGPSGVGKTEIFRQIAANLNIPILITTVTGLSQAGYVGGSTEDILSSLLALTDGNVEAAEHAIVILDEFDKIAYHGYDSGSISTDGVQSELLKIVEDGTFNVTYENSESKIKMMISTKNITFVGVGAFTNILIETKDKEMGFGADIYSKTISKDTISSEELIKFGLKAELVGRMGKVIKLNNLTIDVMKDIVKAKYDEKISLIKSLGIQLDNLSEDELITKIATIAFKKGIGARSVNSIIDEIFSDVMFEVSDFDEKYSALELSSDIVENHKKYILRK